METEALLEVGRADGDQELQELPVDPALSGSIESARQIEDLLTKFTRRIEDLEKLTLSSKPRYPLSPISILLFIAVSGFALAINWTLLANHATLTHFTFGNIGSALLFLLVCISILLDLSALRRRPGHIAPEVLLEIREIPGQMQAIGKLRDQWQLNYQEAFRSTEKKWIELQNVENQLRLMLSHVQTTQSDLEGIEQQRNAKQTELANLEDEIKRTRCDIELTSSEREEHEKEQQKLLQEISDLQASLHKLVEQQTTLDADLLSRRNQFESEIAKERESAQQQQKAMAEDLERNLLARKNELEAELASIAETEQSKLHQRVQDLQLKSDELTQEIGELEKEHIERHRLLETLKQSVEEVSFTKSECQQALELARTELGDVKSQTLEQQRVLNELAEQVREAEALRENHFQKNRQIEADCQALLTRLATHESELASCEQSLVTLRTTQLELQVSIAECEAQRDELREEHVQNRARAEATLQELNECLGRRDTARDEYELVSQLRDQAQTECFQHQQQLSSLEAKIESALGTLTATQETLLAKQSELESLEVQHQAVLSRYAQQLEDTSKQSVRLQEKVDLLQLQIQQKSEELFERKKQLIEAKEAFRSIEREREAAEAQVQSCSIQLESLQADAQRIEEEMLDAKTRTQAELAELDGMLEQKRSEIIAMQSEFAEAAQQLERIQQEMIELSEQKITRKVELNAIAAQLEEGELQIAKQNVLKQSLEGEIESNSREIAGQQAIIADLQSQLSYLSHQSSEAIARKEQANVELVSLNREICEKKQACDELRTEHEIALNQFRIETARLSDVQSQLVALEQEKETKETAMEAELTRAEAAYVQRQQECEGLIDQAQSIREEVADLLQQIEVAKANHLAMTSNHMEWLASKEQEQQLAEATLQHQEQLITNAQTTLAQLERELAQKSVQLSELEAYYDTQRSRWKKTEEEAEDALAVLRENAKQFQREIMQAEAKQFELEKQNDKQLSEIQKLKTIEWIYKCAAIPKRFSCAT